MDNYVPFSDPWLRCPRWAERCQWRRHLLSLPGFLLLITLAPAPAQRGHPPLQTITAALQHLHNPTAAFLWPKYTAASIIGSLLVSKWLPALYRKLIFGFGVHTVHSFSVTVSTTNEFLII